jgi:hypothetical protein
MSGPWAEWIAAGAGTHVILLVASLVIGLIAVTR